jgi:two-component sensor histidine kinase
LVLNELMTNALKHGFLDRHAPLEMTSSPSEARSMIGISLQRSNGAVELVVSNNGCPLPPDFDLTACESLGLSLVKLLTEQLEGELSVSDDVGVAFRLKFPLPSEDQGDGEP